MPGLTDVGNGNKMFEIGDAAETATKLLSLTDLANRIKKAPAELIKAEADAKIAQFESSQDMLTAKLIKTTADAHAAVGNELRAKADFALKGLGSLGDALGQNFEAGKIYGKSLIAAGVLPPGTDFTKSEKTPGTFSIMVPRGDGSLSVLPIDPNRLASAKDRAEMGLKYKDSWDKYGQGWAVVADNTQNFRANINIGTGAGDHVAAYAFQKMLDRTTQVGQGQSEEMKANIAGFRTIITNALEKSKDPDAPLFGPPGSSTRKALIDAANKVYLNAEHHALSTAAFHASLAKNTDNPEGVITPWGGIGYKQAIGEAPVDTFFSKTGRQEKAGASDKDGNPIPKNPLPISRARIGAEPKQASVIPTGNAPAVQSVEAPKKKETIQDVLGADRLFHQGAK